MESPDELHGPSVSWFGVIPSFFFASKEAPEGCAMEVQARLTASLYISKSCGFMRCGTKIDMGARSFRHLCSPVPGASVEASFSGSF